MSKKFNFISWPSTFNRELLDVLSIIFIHVFLIFQLEKFNFWTTFFCFIDFPLARWSLAKITSEHCALALRSVQEAQIVHSSKKPVVNFHTYFQWYRDSFHRRKISRFLQQCWQIQHHYRLKECSFAFFLLAILHIFSKGSCSAVYSCFFAVDSSLNNIL